MASTRERLLGYVVKRVMTDEGWRYYCTECCDYHPIQQFYKAANRPFGIFSHCSKLKHPTKKKNRITDPSLSKVDTSHLKLNKVNEEDIKNTIDFLEQIGYDTTGNVHEQFIKKYENEIQRAISKRHANPNDPKKNG